MVRKYLGGLSRLEILKLKSRVAPYLRFRNEVRGFQEDYLSEICTRKCFAGGTSFCCGRVRMRGEAWKSRIRDRPWGSSTYHYKVRISLGLWKGRIGHGSFLLLNRRCIFPLSLGSDTLSPKLRPSLPHAFPSRKPMARNPRESKKDKWG